MTGAPIVRFAGAATLIREWVADHVDPPVGLQRPVPTVGRCVTVVRVGGSRPTPVTEAARIVVDSWAAKLEDAEALAEEVAVVMAQLAGQQVGGVTCYRVDETSRPSYLPAADGMPRFTAGYEIHLRGDQA